MAESNLLGQQVQGYTITKKLGSGGYGTVYLGVKEDMGKQYQTAIKHISIPDSEGYESVLQDYGYDKAAAQSHFEKLVAGITSEINTLLELSKKDNRYIVAYYDHDIQKSAEPLRFDIFMRMECLTPLARSIRQKGLTVGEVLKLGLNMCDALALCHNNDVMHRDIKEANIFVSDTGNFKLGDFGVAKTALETTQAGSIKGTASYMAPEIYLREPYDRSIDIYSLGIVMYKLMNNQRLPFMPDAPAVFTADDKNNAETRRLKGETPPLPFNAKNRLGEIIVKACSVKELRYKTAEEFKKDLSSYIGTLTNAEYDTVVVPQAADADESSQTISSLDTYIQSQGATVTMAAQDSQFVKSPTVQQNPYAEEKKPKKKKKKFLVIVPILLIIAAAAGIAYYMLFSKTADPLNQFQTAVQEDDFITAAQLFRDEIKSGDSQKLEEAEQFVSNHAESVRDAYFNSEIEYEDALTKMKEIGKLKIVTEEELEPLIAEVNELRTSRAAYERAQKEMEAANYEAAINELGKVIQTDSNYTNAQSMLANAVKGFKDSVFASLSEYERDKRYENAITDINKALLIVPDDADLLAKIDDYNKAIADEEKSKIDTIIRDARDMVSNGNDYERAITLLKNSQAQHRGNEDLISAIDEISDEHANSIIAEADELALDKNYTEAIAVLEGASRLYPANSEIKTRISGYQEFLPVYLKNIDYLSQTVGVYDWDISKDMDNLGNLYINGGILIEGRDRNRAYYTNDEYASFKGKIVLEMSSKNTGYVSQLVIYSDNEVIFVSPNITGGFVPMDFDLDISGCEKITIMLQGDYGVKVGVVDAGFYKK